MVAFIFYSEIGFAVIGLCFNFGLPLLCLAELLILGKKNLEFPMGLLGIDIKSATVFFFFFGFADKGRGLEGIS